MPIKKMPPPIATKPLSRPNNKKKAPPKQQKEPLAPEVELGPALDPSTLPGANEQAPSLSGKIYDVSLPNAKQPLTFQFCSQERHPKKSAWLWRQCGAAIVIEGLLGSKLNVRYIGRFDSEMIRGEATNPDGEAWAWSGSLSAATEARIFCDHDPLS